LDITLPHIPCFIIGLDVIDMAGENHNNIDDHNIFKTRLNPSGGILSIEKAEVNKVNRISNETCGNCYGASLGCCNTCQDVRTAYIKIGWTINVENIKQCLREHFSEKLAKQKHEGCQIHGFFNINKVQGNIHIAPGISSQLIGQHVHDLTDFMGPDKNWVFIFLISGFFTYNQFLFFW
jgi:hypothetical protein